MNLRDKKMKPVPILKRIIAFAVDSFLLSSILFSSILIYFKIVPIENEANINMFALFIVIIFIIYVIIDHILIPSNTGYTLSRWLCSYKIIDKNTGSNPSLLKCTFRYFIFAILEVFTILGGFLSLVSSFARQDKAAIHDILSKTLVINCSVKSGYRYLKYFGIIVIIVINLQLFSYLVYMVDDVFVYPTMLSYNTKNKLKDVQLINSNDTRSKFYSIGNVPLFEVNVTDEIAVNIIAESKSSTEAELLINGYKFKSTVVTVIQNGTTISKEDPIRVFDIWSLKTLKDIAFESAFSIRPNFDLLTPISNLKASYLRTIIPLIISDNNEFYPEFDIYNDEIYLRCHSIKKGKIVHYVQYALFHENEFKLIHIFNESNTVESSLLLSSYIEGIKSINFTNLISIKRNKI